ncbi:probable inactive receptor kinase At5g10020 isoform X2 [Gastrolobium bilobum]|uniref:probable inactive receptor kinase At5g10020 isoform X2 n=1 Tax=Gastrolobium bilobum TaxID=150636 RepID=UPI002AB021A6|nr:probable inactive receptor kinase At5g10020 isoform X2 [Gastrolobium bilobum]
MNPFLLILLLSLFVSVSSLSQPELRSLLEFKKGITTDPLRKVLESWNPTSLADYTACPRSWEGILCDDLTGNVTGIVLDRLGLGGELKFQTLLELKMLRNLSLSGNHFTGRLTPSLGTLTTLQHLDLSQNKFYGPIPSRINELWGLNYLNLSFNEFKGGFPTSLTNLQQLRVLDLHSNALWGDIGDILSTLRNVEHVDLSLNQFFGGLDLSVQNVSGLANTVHFLNFSHNNLNGPFFGSDSVQLFRNLQVLDLTNNLITGSIAVINSTTLNSLNLSSNGLSGSLPTSLGSCTVIDLSRNMLSGDISVIQNWEATLEVIDLSSNKLSGSLPPILGTYSKLSTIDLSLNELSGSIPGSLVASPSLTRLNLSGNLFTGALRLQSSGASELLLMPPYQPMEYLDVSNNSLEGVLPSDISRMGGLKLLNLARNGFSGQLPDELSKLSYLEYLDLSNNKFTGNIPDKLSSSITVFNVSYNDLSGRVPENLQRFPPSSFHPGNEKLRLPNGSPGASSVPDNIPDTGRHHNSKGNIRIAIILASVGAAVMIAFVLLAYHRTQLKEFRGRSEFTGQTTERDVKLGGLTRPSLFKFNSNVQPPTTSLSFSNDHLLTSNSRSLSGQTEFITEISEHGLPQGMVATSSASVTPNLMDNPPTSSGRKSSPGSPLSSSPRFIEGSEKPAMLDVYSPDRLAGELFFLDSSMAFTAEDLSRAPAEVLGRSSHGTLYKATLDSGHMLTVKWLRVGLVKHKKEFAREVKRIGSMRHPNIVSLRAYYWGPREQERLLLADYIHGDSLALHLYETTPRRHSRLSFSQRLRVAVDVARCLLYLHDRGLPHGNLKPTNILLAGHENNARLSDYGLHRLMTPAGIAEQILNLGALGYRAPELAAASKPVPSFKADVYALGVILMELLTRKSAGDIISGQSGAVDLTDWVRLCEREGRVMDCIDRDIAGGEDSSKEMDELLAISLRCILPVNERPNIRQVFDDLCSISV